MKYEYQMKSFEDQVTVDVLNINGDEGWLLVSANHNDGHIICIFVREINDQVAKNKPDLSFLGYAVVLMLALSLFSYFWVDA